MRWSWENIAKVSFLTRTRCYQNIKRLHHLNENKNAKLSILARIWYLQRCNRTLAELKVNRAIHTGPYSTWQHHTENYYETIRDYRGPYCTKRGKREGASQAQLVISYFRKHIYLICRACTFGRMLHIFAHAVLEYSYIFNLPPGTFIST